MNFVALDIGSTGGEVRKLQEELKNLGYRMPQVTGNYDEATKRAVRAFQNDNGLQMTGRIDEDTWQRINQAASGDAQVVDDDKPNAQQESAAHERGEQTDWDRLMDDGTDIETPPTYEEVEQAADEPKTDNSPYFNTAPAPLTAEANISSAADVPEAAEEAAVEGSTVEGSAVEGSTSVDGRENEIAKESAAFSDGRASGRAVWPRRYSDYPIPAIRNNYKDIQPASAMRAAGTVFEEDVPEEYKRPALPAHEMLSERSERDEAELVESEIVPESKPTWSGELRTVQWGNRNRTVKLLQRRLTEMGYYNGNVNGNFGFETRMAVMTFQNDNDLKSDGIVGANTWNAMYQVLGTIKDKETNAARSAMTLQKHLRDLGYYQGQLDGIFGGSTGKAVETFQRENDLTANGIVDADTWQALETFKESDE